MIEQWLLFTATAIIIVIAGIFISYFGNAIAVRTGLGGLWIGVVLIAFATSLPELTTAVSAGRLGVPNLSAGDLFGSGIYNLAILAALDLIYYRRKMLKSVTLGHVVSGGLAIAMTAAAAIFIILRSDYSIAWISWSSLILLLIYIDGIWLVKRNEEAISKKRLESRTKKAEVKVSAFLLERPWWQLGLGMTAAALAIFIAAPLMITAANKISLATGLKETFFGTLLIAFVTSLPELAVSVTAVRLGAFDLVVGNIFGSNSFNMATLVVLDIFYTKGSIFAVISPINAITGLFIILITTLALMGLVFHSEKRYLFVEPDAVLILILCGLAMFLVWRF